ncbi:MAG TPA: AraC family transcriptional regulator [Anditalea sp.]|nr:AraC family transcriptional regulator [Anditalea sp.]
MIEELKIEDNHHGFLFLYNSKEHLQGMQKPHKHKELELNIVIRGSAEYILPNQKYNLTPGNIVWLFPGQEHRLIKTDPNFQMYVIVFTEDLFKKITFTEKKYCLLNNPNPSGSFCRKISISSLEKLEKICQMLCDLNSNKEIISPAYYYAGQAFGFNKNSFYHHKDPVLLNSGLSYLMTIGWHLYLTEGAEEIKERINPQVEMAIKLLRKNPEKDYGLSELAMECGVSSSRLSRLFNDQLNLSIVDYKNKLKLERLLECLKENPNYSISEACYTVGFGSYSQFYKIFTKHFGISPKAYFLV